MIRWATLLAEVPVGLDAPVVLIVRAEAMAGFPPAPPGYGGDSAQRRRVIAALAGRVVGLHPATVELIASPGGQRMLGGIAGVFASIASRTGWIVAALAREPVGVDVESAAEAEAGRDAALDGFDGDLAAWHGPAGVWAAKEAALKLHGRGIGTPTEWRFGDNGTLTLDAQPVTVVCYALPDAVAALALSGNNSRAAPAASSAPAS